MLGVSVWLDLRLRGMQVWSVTWAGQSIAKAGLFSRGEVNSGRDGPEYSSYFALDAFTIDEDDGTRVDGRCRGEPDKV